MSSPFQPDAPAFAEEAKQRGNRHMVAGALDEAAACYREALQLRPDFAEAHNNLGLVHMARGERAEARACFACALALNPGLALAHFNLGVIAEEEGELERAYTCYEETLRRLPDHAPAALHLAHALHRLARAAEALSVLERLVARSPDLAEAHANMGLVLRELGRHDEALVSYQRALELDGDPGHHYSLGLINQDMQRWPQALDCYRTACRLNPDHSLAQRNLTFLLLLLDDYDEGLRLHERRLHVADAKSRQWPGAQYFIAALSADRYWNGAALDGRRLLVWTEQGLGDSIMMARYLPMLKTRAGAGRLTVLCEPPLERLLREIPCVDDVIVKTPGGEAVPAFDVHCSTMSLPFLFGTRLEAVPSKVPYLIAPPAERRRWADRLAALPDVRAGLVWGGNPGMEKDALRSIALRDFAAALNVEGISWVSLQKGGPAAQLADVQASIMDWMDDARDLLDTAALVAELDLVVCVDTAVAHLAGALGKPVWLLNRFESEWRWGIGRELSPWYPTMRIFRQPALHDWASVVERVAGELRKFSAGEKPTCSSA